ncbi:tetratricopeptide repeat protein [Brevibacillus fulvus]|uniref:Tetratricopeptide (TPR) repeat protein n=1 Tax=Brevibacillus fulvus TaxID=1125967 RepID=A0A939BU28_9BACL|nr:tetratricopeptide repeat protein [Brevibacillus fulvus]MBM7592113.1 tetratricopeptide (TPR) repeat protein [Brevibacillus fulvus]
MKSRETANKTTVVEFRRDARFFCDRGFRLLRRNDVEKALLCFQRAIELEPNNPDYRCHLASTLAEMGQFEASNNVLYEIIETLAPSMEDAYFFLANNYANMEDFEMAEEMAVLYLQKNKRGTFAEEAEELLDYIYFELDLPPRQFFMETDDDVFVKHELARRSLEEGRFLEALQILKNIVEAEPDFMPAWNNLSLAYYYVGQFEQAMATIDQTLEREPNNLHALCNLAVLLSHQNQSAQLVELLVKLKKITPLNHDHLYKLATTMGVLGQHEEAFRLYQRMIRSFPGQDACTYHYAAISAYLTNRFEQARRWWGKVKQLDPDAGIAEHYLQLLKEQKSGETTKQISYHYHRPYDDLMADRINEQSVDKFKTDPMIRASLLWALQHGKEDIKHTVIQTLGMIGDDEAEEAIRKFYQETDNSQLKKTALLALAQMGAPLPTESEPCAEGQDAVQAAIRFYFHQQNDSELRKWSEQIWAEYKKQAAKPLQVRKEVAWMAAFEYLYGLICGHKRSQQEIAEKYGISVATLTRCYKELSRLDLNQF